MTDDQIIAVAKVVRNGGHWDQLDIINFGRLIAAAEREACAKLCAQYVNSPNDRTALTALNIHDAIRARGNT